MDSSDRNSISRRDFIRAAVGSAAAMGALTSSLPTQLLGETAHAAAGMPVRPLGRTGHNVRLFSLGGQGLLEQAGHTDEAAAIINRAIDLGINYIDTAFWYGNGCSETYIGEVLKTRRKEVYLATKSGMRNYDGAMRELEISLKRLQTDRLDCWQMHNVRTPDDVSKIFASNGALKAFQKARDEKITRFIGVTGHRNPFVLKDAIERFEFDTILMAVNAADIHLAGSGDEASFITNLLPAATARKLGIIGMKIPAKGRIFPPKGGLGSMEQAMTYVLTLPVSTVIVGISKLEELDENVRIATSFKPYTQAQMAEVEALTKPAYAEATFFKRERGY